MKDDGSKIFVFYKSREGLEEWLENFLRTDVLPRKIIKMNDTHNYTIVYPNGTYIKTIFVFNRTRGYKCNIAYVDPTLDEKNYKCIYQTFFKKESLRSRRKNGK